MQAATTLFAKDSIVFAKSDGIHVCKYSIHTDTWMVDLRTDSETAPESHQSLRLAHSNDLPDLWKMGSQQSEELTNTTKQRMKSSAAYLIIAKLCSGRKKFFIVLVPASQFPGVDMIFLPSSKGLTQQDTTLYHNIGKKKPASIGHILFDQSDALTITLHVFEKGSYLHIKDKDHGSDRKETWLRTVCTSTSREKERKRPRGQLVELPRVSADALKHKVPKGEITLRIGYAGGKKHAVHRPIPVLTDVESLVRTYKAAPASLSEYHLSQTTDKFQTLLAPDRIQHAINSVRTKARSAPHGMDTEDTNDLLGAIASVFYEDIGWRMQASPPPCAALLDYISADVDQVQTFALGNSETSFLMGDVCYCRWCCTSRRSAFAKSYPPERTPTVCPHSSTLLWTRF